LRDANLKQQYVEFIDEFLELEHMEATKSESSPSNSEFPSYLMPHHTVLRPHSLITKLRVVFDASAKSNTGLSLNAGLKVGATVPQELFHKNCSTSCYASENTSTPSQQT
jgi:hypothetical protein